MFSSCNTVLACDWLLQENMWGPAPAVNPNIAGHQHATTARNQDDTAGARQASGNAASSGGGGGGAGGGRKKNKRMQKIDSSILGFTLTAAAGRVNVGEIENPH